MTSTHILLRVSALVLATLGLAALFLPAEIMEVFGVATSKPAELPVQLLGAAWLGLAALNWSQRHQIVGGIYGRGVSLPNFFHATVAAATLLKVVALGERHPVVVVLTIVFVLLAVWFGRVTFTHPGPGTDG